MRKKELENEYKELYNKYNSCRWRVDVMEKRANNLKAQLADKDFEIAMLKQELRRASELMSEYVAFYEQVKENIELFEG